MAEDYSEYIIALQKLQRRKIEDRREVRLRLAATIAALSPFAEALLLAGEIENYAVSHSGSDRPCLTIHPVESSNDIFVVVCFAKPDRVDPKARPEPTLEIKTQNKALEKPAHLLGESFPAGHVQQRQDQGEQREQIFGAILEIIAQIKADNVDTAGGSED